jgi:hypothetical protein
MDEVFGRSRAGCPDREEQLWIDAAARGALTPVHVFTIPSAALDRARMSPLASTLARGSPGLPCHRGQMRD